MVMLIHIQYNLAFCLIYLNLKQSLEACIFQFIKSNVVVIEGKSKSRTLVGNINFYL